MYRLFLLGASELQLVRLDDVPEVDLGLSSVPLMPSLGPRTLGGRSSISDDSTTVGDPYMGVPGASRCTGSNVLGRPGVPKPECEASGPILATISPLLPELTVMFGGRLGFNGSLDAIADLDMEYK